MQTQTQYKTCMVCGRLAISQCQRCAIIGFIFLIFSISDVISTIAWGLGLVGIIGAVFWFVIMLCYCIGSCNLKDINPGTEYIEIIK